MNPVLLAILPALNSFRRVGKFSLVLAILLMLFSSAIAHIFAVSVGGSTLVSAMWPIVTLAALMAAGGDVFGRIIETALVKGSSKASR